MAVEQDEGKVHNRTRLVTETDLMNKVRERLGIVDRA